MKPSSNTKHIMCLLLSIFVVAGGCDSRKREDKKAEQKTQISEEEKKLQEKLKVIAAVYEAVDQEGEYGKGKERSLAIALYNLKGEIKPHVIVALSGRDGELIDAEATKSINLKLERLNTRTKQLAESIPISEKDITIPYTLVSLDTTLIDNANDKTIVDRNRKQVGKLLEEGFVTLKQDPQPYNLRDSDAEAALVRHINKYADLEADIVVFSVRAICGSCGGVKYDEQTSGWYKDSILRHFKMKSGSNLFDQQVKDRDGFEKDLTAEYVRRGLLGQLAERIEKGTLYAVEFKPSLSEGKVYKWTWNRRILAKQIYQGNDNWTNVPEVG
jgi:hypothetical protein